MINFLIYTARFQVEKIKYFFIGAEAIGVGIHDLTD